MTATLGAAGDEAEKLPYKETLKKLGISDDFLETLLLTLDDWTFVIRAHALLEAAVTHVIVSELDRPELADVIAGLETANDRTGKIAFAKALGLLEKEHRRFVVHTSTLRNLLVHDVRNSGFRFSGHPSGIAVQDNEKIRNSSANAIDSASALVPGATVRFEGRDWPKREFSRAHPRFAFLIGLAVVLKAVYDALGGYDPMVRALMKLTLNQPTQ